MLIKQHVVEQTKHYNLKEYIYLLPATTGQKRKAMSLNSCTKAKSSEQQSGCECLSKKKKKSSIKGENKVVSTYPFVFLVL